MSYPYGIAKVYAPVPHRVFGGEIYRRTSDVALPLEPRRVLFVGGRAGPSARPHTENRVMRVLDLIAPVVERAQRPFVVGPTPPPVPEVQEAYLLRSFEVVDVTLEYRRDVQQVVPPLPPTPPAPVNRVAMRVPDVALPLEYRRSTIFGGHSLRVPDYSGVRA